MEDWEMMIVNKNIGDMTESELKDFIIELQEENSRYERINQKYKEVIDKLNKYIKLLGKYDGEKCTRGFSMMTADFNKLLDILKGVE